MIAPVVSLVKNGSLDVRFYTYSCEFCGKLLPECDPKIQLKGGSYGCCDCSFIGGYIDEQKYLKTECFWINTKNSYAYIEDGKIIIGTGKRRKTQKDKRSSPEYAEWRTSVFERDGYTCLRCGAKGGELNAHHIKPYKQHKGLRLDISNGQTLCIACHRIEHGSH